MDESGQAPIKDTAENSLEGTGTVVEPTSNDPATTPTSTTETPPAVDQTSSSMPLATPPTSPGNSPPPKKPSLRDHLEGLNVYLLGFIFVIIIAVVIVVLAITKNHKSATPTISTTNLSQSQLQQLAASSSTIGSANQVLNISSNAIFGQQVLIQKDLDVAGNLKLGGTLSLPSITVNGTSTFGQTQISQLTISGNTAIQGGLSVGQQLSVAGSANFSGAVSVGTLTVQTLDLGGNLTISHHIDTIGANPSRADGTALGSGGTSSVSGNDTAGSIAINTGGSPAAGCFITVNFTTAFSSTPNVIITPIDSGAAGIAYYVNRSTSSFSVCTASVPPAGISFGFDYLVVD